MRERLQVRLTRAAKQFRERQRQIDVRPQHECVDEHSDHIVEFLLTTPRDRSTDHDVGGAGQARQHHGECTVHDHESRSLMLTRNSVEGIDDALLDGKLVLCTTVRCYGWTWPIGRQVQLIRDSREPALPVVDLARDDRVRIVLAAEHLTLPQGVVDELDSQRRPGRRTPVRSRRIRCHHVTYQRHHRETVSADVMDDEDKHVLIVGKLEERGTERDLDRDVESGLDQLPHTEFHSLGRNSNR